VAGKGSRNGLQH